jgi:peptide/nickel transport system permease protein
MNRWFIAGPLRMLAVMVVASLAGALLIRCAPGFSTDPQDLNAGLSPQSHRAIREARLAEGDLPRFYFRYVTSLARGDLGRSLSLNQPVSELLRERLPATLWNLGLALLLAWLLGLALAIASTALNSSFLAVLNDGLSGVFVSIPAAALALVFVFLRLPPFAAAGLLLFPKIYRYSANLLGEGYEAPHVLMARAKGAGRWRLLTWHVAPGCMPQWIALMGVSISVGLGLLLPVEVISDTPGIGQLAWQAAQSRDLTLLVNLTLVVTFLTVFATTLSDAARRGFTRGAA